MPDRFFRQCLFWLAFSAALLIYIGRYTDIDIALADWMYDPGSRAFPWRDNWFATVLVHQWLKWLLIVLGAGVIIALIVDARSSTRRLTPDVRRKLSVVALSYLLVPLIVRLLKYESPYHCPWDLQRYGGSQPYLRIFDSLLPGMTAGHCFPAGHASSGLWIASVAVFWLPQRPRMAAMMFAIGLLPGFLLGWVQQMRGAHFFTHTLWSVWITAAVTVLLARFLAVPAINTIRSRRAIP